MGAVGKVIHFIHQIHQTRGSSFLCRSAPSTSEQPSAVAFGGLADDLGQPRGVDVASAMTNLHQHWLVAMHQIDHSTDSVISAPVPRPGVLSGLRERLL